ncbi:MAG TPA: hypothetical protein VHS58_12945 [Acetobacteraceae bacterium]|nr:hypothetical protein [Acetobacteraceae bacterium]
MSASSPSSSSGDLLDRIVGTAERMVRAVAAADGSAADKFLAMSLIVMTFIRVATIYLRWKAGLLPVPRGAAPDRGPSAPPASTQPSLPRDRAAVAHADQHGHRPGASRRASSPAGGELASSTEVLDPATTDGSACPVLLTRRPDPRSPPSLHAQFEKWTTAPVRSHELTVAIS